MRVSYRLVPIIALVLLAGTSLFSPATAFAQEAGFVVASSQLNVRAAPNTSAAMVAVLARGDELQVFGRVAGEEVFPGNPTWFRTRSGFFVYSGLTRPAGGQGDSNYVGRSGRWIEVDRSAQVARAIENRRVVRTALVTVGRRGFPTPVGTFAILRRVANETMDSRTIGVPLSSPQGYYLKDVLYTQYINESGVAIHYNYWSPPEAFGSRPESRGCIGMRLSDAEFFWDFADVGTIVVINP